MSQALRRQPPRPQASRVGSLVAALVQLPLQPLDVLTNGGQFLLADEPHPADRALHLGADQPDQQLTVRPALFDQVLGNALNLFGEHFRRLGTLCEQGFGRLFSLFGGRLH